jgi:hypothetical protein
MRERYGLDQRDWPTVALVAVIIAAFLGILLWITVASGTRDVQFRLLSWTVVSPTQVNITYEVRPPKDRTAYCVLRAQDSTRTDVGYRIVELPTGSDYQRITTELTTLIPAYTVEILGCGLDEPPLVNEPQFPPGVVPPR